MAYDFNTLSDADFEDLARDLIGREMGIRFEAFCAGPDGGIDGRHAPADKDTILQAKHFAGSAASQLKYTMKKERPTIDALNPARYCLATSCKITPAAKTALANIIGSSLKGQGDIFGPEDLNGLLRKFPDVEKAHIKLWLSSSAILDRVVNAAAHTFAAITRNEIAAKVRVYAQNPSFAQSAAKLESQHVLIVSGPAGVGKTTLAEMLAYAYLAEGWDLVPIRSLDDGFASLNDLKKQVFLFDDFLGKVALNKHALAMKDSELARFIRRVRGSTNARFILTTRAYILEEARRVSEHLADQRLNVSKYILDVGVYTRRIRARILYNHLIVAGTPVGHIKALVESGKLSKIVDHKNYNPRVVEWMTDRFHIGDIQPNDYPDAFLEALKNPRQLWDIAFRTHIDDRCRHLLFTLFFSSEYGIEIDDARTSYDTLHRVLCDRYGSPRDPKDFEEAVRILESSFINISGERLSYINPSFRDYMTEYLNDPEILKDFASASRRSNWAEAVWRHGTRVLTSGTNLADLARVFVEIAQNFEKWPTWRRSKSDPRMMSIGDSSNAARLSLLLEWWTHSQDSRFSSAALSLAGNPPEGWNSWRDSETMIDLISKIRDGDYYEGLPHSEELADILELGVIEMLKTGISSDDLERLSDAIEDAGQLLGTDVSVAIGELIAEEFRDIYRRAADMDSESTLEEHLETLTKLAPRAGVPQAQVSLAESVIRSRIEEVAEEAGSASSPAFNLSKEDMDMFDDKELKNLFVPLLSRAIA